MSRLIKSISNAIHYWYIPLIVGVIFLLTGIYTIFSPLESYLALSVLFSFSFLISGVSEIIFSVSNRNEIDNWGWTLIFGILTAIFGILLLSNPEISMITLPFYIGIVVLFRSFMGIAVALDLRKYGILEWGNLMVVAILGVVFSFILIWNPVLAGLTVITWTSFAFIATGVFSIYLSIKLKKLKNKL